MAPVLPCCLRCTPAASHPCPRPDPAARPALPAPAAAVDKRLDEWAGQERVASIARVASADALHRVASGGGSGDLGPLAGDQKMTRRLKRQYTEIHHVPAALEELPPIDQVPACSAAASPLLHGWRCCQPTAARLALLPSRDLLAAGCVGAVPVAVVEWLLPLPQLALPDLCAQPGSPSLS